MNQTKEITRPDGRKVTATWTKEGDSSGYRIPKSERDFFVGHYSGAHEEIFTCHMYDGWFYMC